MKRYKNKILVLSFIGILIIGFGAWRTVEAADASIYVSPAQASKEIGDIFDITVKVNPSGQKVCVVEGKMILTKLSCQKVTTGSGISAQTSPSCDDLSFLLGIQGCTTSEKTLFTVRVKTKSAGFGTAEFTGVDIIGEGASISSTSSGGSYAITSTPSCDCTSWQDKACGGNDCSAEQQFQTRTCTPSGCALESRCVDDSSCVSVPLVEGEEVEGEEEEKEEEEMVILPEEKVIRESWLAGLAMVWGGTSQLTLIIVIGILSIIFLVFIGAREWKLFQKKRKI